MKSLRLWGNLVIDLDKNILIERNDYTIYNARDSLGIKYFGGQYKFAMRIYMATILNCSKRN